MAQQRRTFTGEEKVALLRRHLLDGVAVSDLHDGHGLNPTILYRWQKAFFENGAAAFERRSSSEMVLTSRREETTIRTVGETEAGHAGERPAGDSRPGRRALRLRV